MSGSEISKLISSKMNLSEEELQRWLEEVRWEGVSEAEQDDDVEEINEAVNDELSSLQELKSKIADRLNDPRADANMRDKLEDLLDRVMEQIDGYEKFSHSVMLVDEELESRTIDWENGGGGIKSIPGKFEDTTYTVTFSATTNPFTNEGDEVTNPFNTDMDNLDPASLDLNGDNPFAGANVQTLDLSAYAHQVSEWRLVQSAEESGRSGYGNFTLIGDSINGQGQVIIELKNVPINPDLKNPNIKIILPINDKDEANMMPEGLTRMFYTSLNDPHSFHYHLFGPELPEELAEVQTSGLSEAISLLGAGPFSAIPGTLGNEVSSILEAIYTETVEKEPDVNKVINQEISRLKSAGYSQAQIQHIISVLILTLYNSDIEKYDEFIAPRADFFQRIIEGNTKEEDLTTEQMAMIMLLDTAEDAQVKADNRFSDEIETEEEDDDGEKIYNYKDGEWPDQEKNIKALKLLQTLTNNYPERVGFDIDEKIELEEKAIARFDAQEIEEKDLEEKEDYLDNPMPSEGSLLAQLFQGKIKNGQMSNANFNNDLFNSEIDGFLKGAYPNEKSDEVLKSQENNVLGGYPANANALRPILREAMKILVDPSIKSLEDRQDAILTYMESLDLKYQDDFVVMFTHVLAKFDKKLYATMFYDLTPKDLERTPVRLEKGKENSFAERLMEVFNSSNNVFGRYEMRLRNAQDYFYTLGTRGKFISSKIRESGRQYGLS